MAALLVAILIHELGHALVMRSYGFWPSIVLHGFGGVTVPGPGRGRPLTRFDDILISVAGPAAGFLAAAAVFFALRAAGYVTVLVVGDLFIPIAWVASVVGSEAFTLFLNDFLFICVFWGVLNLLPIYPLDGGHVARNLLSLVNPREGARWSLMISIVVAGAMCVMAFVSWHSLFSAAFFAYLAFISFSALHGDAMY
jgi:Zn-dependent protease